MSFVWDYMVNFGASLLIFWIPLMIYIYLWGKAAEVWYNLIVERRAGEE